jgi:hypothetical protein
MSIRVDAYEVSLHFGFHNSIKIFTIIGFFIELSVGVAKASPRLILASLWEAGETRQPSEVGHHTIKPRYEA